MSVGILNLVYQAGAKQPGKYIYCNRLSSRPYSDVTFLF